MKNRKGFTLIELLAVIIILAVIALIATPIVLNVVDSAKKNANKNSVYGLLDGAKLYYTESLLDSSKSSDINGSTNLIDKINISGDNPDSGYIYINSDGQTAIAVVYDKICYTKNFSDNDLKESEEIENCKINIEETPEVSYKCRRATILHTEECTQTSNYCYAAGYTTTGSKGTTTITYGNPTTTDDVLTSGDAFDCDLNGDETYDSETERFYYVSDLYDTTTQSFNSSYAVLVYYNNTTSGVADNTNKGLTPYYSSAQENWHGPVTAVTKLPTITQWNNVSLSDANRAILTQTGKTMTSGGDLPTEFSYAGYAARLLTFQEAAIACGGDGYPASDGELDTCNYLMENTKYSNSSLGTIGYWLENPDSTSSYNSFYVSSSERKMSTTSANGNSGSHGVRPAIEVLKTNIDY